MCVCVLHTPVGRDTADLMARSSSVFYMQSLLPACVFSCVGGYMIHNHDSFLSVASALRISADTNSPTDHHIRELAALRNHDASRRHGAAAQVKVLERSLWASLPRQAMHKIQLWNTVRIRSCSQLTCHRENRVADGNVSSSSTLGGSMHLFSRFIQVHSLSR